MDNKKKESILIIGTIPPPIGGVTIHVDRLLKFLNKEGINFIFIDLKKHGLIPSIRTIFNSKIIHLYNSNPIMRLFFSIITLLSLKILILTYPGNLGRYGYYYNILDYLSLFLCTYPILFNDESYKKALKYNQNAQLFSSFIPPEDNTMDFKTKELLSDFLNNERITFCTNAYNIAIDKYKHEIYSITELVRIFSSLHDKQLIISDPSGQYTSYISSKQNLPLNILFLNYPNDFIRVINESDCLIRATTTDGDSLSIKEALYFNKNVIASNCVSRPKEVILYETNNFESLKNKILDFKPSTLTVQNIKNGAEQLIIFYKNIFTACNI